MCSRFYIHQFWGGKKDLPATRRHIPESCDIRDHVGKNLKSRIFYVYFTRQEECMSGMSFLIFTTVK